MKRAFDIFVSIILLILTLPLMILISFLILIFMGKPILFKQQRPGLHGKPFYMLKFRTMNDLKDENGNLLPNEKRLTKLGAILRKLSLDELPQLINVLRGEMSLVGPRPLLMEYLPFYTEEQMRRHEVRPGITGWAQVNGRNLITWEEKFKLDVWYIDNYSFWLDIKILFLTLKKAIKAEGVEIDGVAKNGKFPQSKTGGHDN